MKSGHHLSHDRVSKGYGSTPCLTSQTSLHACLQRLNTMQISLWHQTRNRPMPLTSSVMWQMMARFRNFIQRDLVEKAQCVSNRCKDSFKQKKYFGVMGTLNSRYMYGNGVLNSEYNIQAFCTYNYLLYYGFSKSTDLPIQ